VARYRTIVGDRLWKHPVMQKAPLHVGRLYVYLITEGADCEGRFVADPFTLHEAAFSSRHEVSEEDVRSALVALSNEYDVVLLYSESGKADEPQYGFLTGWYEHQRIPVEYREGSSLPKPPVLCNSWTTVEHVYASYCDFQGQKRSTYKAALRWFEELEDERQKEYIARWRAESGQRADLASYTTVAQKLDNSSATLNKGKEGERKGREEGRIPSTQRLNEDAPRQELHNDPPPTPPPSLPTDSEHEQRKQRCCEMLAPLVDGNPDGALAIVENVLAGYPEYPELVQEACFKLSTRHAKGEKVQLSWLWNNVAELVAEAEEKALLLPPNYKQRRKEFIQLHGPRAEHDYYEAQGWDIDLRRFCECPLGWIAMHPEEQARAVTLGLWGGTDEELEQGRRENYEWQRQNDAHLYGEDSTMYRYLWVNPGVNLRDEYEQSA